MDEQTTIEITNCLKEINIMCNQIISLKEKVLVLKKKNNELELRISKLEKQNVR